MARVRYRCFMNRNGRKDGPFPKRETCGHGPPHWRFAMALRNLLFAGAAIAALSGGAGIALADDEKEQEQTRHLKTQEFEKGQATHSHLKTIRPLPIKQTRPDRLPAASGQKTRAE